MRRILTRLAALSLLAVLAFAPSAGAQGQTTTVSIEDFFFSPANITVAPGTTVTWVNNGRAPHTATATSPSGAFDSGTLQPGQSFSFTFNRPGTYAYHCAIHPFMSGTVTVSGVSAAAGGLPGTGGGEWLALSIALALVVSGAVMLALLRRWGGTSL
jgi:plastocyanin